jgi:hypothetical protein
MLLWWCRTAISSSQWGASMRSITSPPTSRNSSYGGELTPTTTRCSLDLGGQQTPKRASWGGLSSHRRNPASGGRQPGSLSGISADSGGGQELRLPVPATGLDSARDRIGCSWNIVPQNAFTERGLVLRKGENAMKILISTLAVALALAFTGPAFAGDVTAAKTEADCTKAGGMWDAAKNMCAEKKP